MSDRILIAAILVAWVVGAAFVPLGGMIHVLLIAAVIVIILVRVGRQD